jgi:hypothetical protein
VRGSCAGSNLIACVSQILHVCGRIDFPFKYGFGIIALLKWVSKIPPEGAGVRPAKRDADVAQSAEHPPCKRAVTSSILVVGSTGKRIDHFRECQPIKTLYLGSYPSGQRGLTVNQLSEDFGGSNPSPPTIPNTVGTARAVPT